MNPLQQLMDEALEKVENRAYPEALELYREARKHAEDPETYFLIGSTIGQLLEWMGRGRKAADQYREDLQWLEIQVPGRRDLRALGLNNLGRALLTSHPVEALDRFDGACAHYRDLAKADPSYLLPLANTLLAKGEAFARQEKYWYAKKDYKEALEIYRNLDSEQADALAAQARYQLGNIYAEEFNAHDARTQYLKARETYESLLETDRTRYLPLLAAVNNNLALVQRDLEEYEQALSLFEKTLEAYRELAGSRPLVFNPYLANTHTSTGILLAEKFRDFSGALHHNTEALQIYEALSKTHPGRYEHYLATAHHNTGIYLAETGQWDGAEAAFDRALGARLELETRQPGSFRADIGATALNLLELYRHRLETTGNWKYHDMGLDLAENSRQHLAELDNTPVHQNMRADLEILKSYFDTVAPGDVKLQSSLEKIRKWEEEVDSTLDLNEKRHYQQRVLNQWKQVHRPGKQAPWVRQSLARALNNMAWLEICIGATDRARAMLREAEETDPGLLSVKCNIAHCDLLDGNPDAANKAYRELWPKKDASGTGFGEVVNKDLIQLIRMGVLGAHHLPNPAGPGEVPTVV